MVRTVTSKQLREIVTDRGMPSMVLFTGSWCVDCMAFKPTWDKWTSGREGSILVLEIQRGDPGWEDWSLREIPTVAVFSDRKEMGRASDQISVDDLDRLWGIVAKR